MTKKELRKEIIDKRKELSFLEIKEKSIFYTKKLESLLENLLGKFNQEINFLAYFSIKGEIDFSNLYKKIIYKEEAKYKKVNLAFPRVEKDEMEFYRIRSFNDLKKGAYSIFEPKAHCEIIDKSLKNIVLTPCLCLNKDKRRLGYGKGYYDKYFSFKKDSIFISAIYEDEKDIDFEASSYDLEINYIL